MITICTWKWGTRFAARHVNTLRSMLARHVHCDHRLLCVTDDPSGLDGDIATAPIEEFTDTPRCRRRMKQFDRAFGAIAGPRQLVIDLDVVITDDLTAIVTRPDPLVCWRVAYAQVYSGSFLMMDAGVLHGLYVKFAAEPSIYPKRAQRNGTPSDQAMLNFYLQRSGMPVAELTEADGLRTYFGRGYERLAHHGVGPSHPELPPGTRIVVLGSADLEVLDQKQFPWVEEHYR